MGADRSTPRAILATAFAGLTRVLSYAVSVLAPRDERVWAFGSDSGRRFSGNTKYLFLHLANEHAEEVRPIWISKRWDIVGELRENGYEAYHADTLQGKYHTLRAGHVCFTHTMNDVDMVYGFGAKNHNLWHGMPLKRIAKDNTYSQGTLELTTRLKTSLLFRRYASVIATSETVVPMFASAFRTDEDDVPVTGYPRNDALFGDIEDAEVGTDASALAEVRALSTEGTVVAYTPTYRDSGGDPFADGGIDLKRLDRLLAAHDAFLVVKLHPWMNSAIDDSFERIVSLPDDCDLYPVLGAVDVLVTDYSSIFFDYLLVDRPVVFFAYDLDQYLAEDREFYFDYEDVTPGPKATDFEELCSALVAAIEKPDEYAAERATVRERFFAHEGGTSAERTYRRLSGIDE